MLRLQKYLRDCLGISRRKAEEVIEQGRVMVNCQKAVIGVSVIPDQDEVVFDGKKVIPLSEELLYIMLNKPKGYVTTRSDPQGRRTVFDLLPRNFSHLFPVGRLDYHTEGLLLLTNDGDWAYRLTHPKFEVEKEYIVVIDGELDREQKSMIEQGLHTPDLKTSRAYIKIFTSSSQQSSLSITIHEGQKREVRRIFEYFGFRVLDLKRIRIQTLLLGDLARSKWRRLEKNEHKKLFS